MTGRRRTIVPRGWRAAVRLPAALLLVAGCSAEGDAALEVPPPESAPQRLVILAPSAAEMVHALGLIHRVVGVGDFVHWPPELRQLPKVGAYDAPNPERVLSLEADLLITTASREAAPQLDRLEGLGVAVLALDTSTYQGVFTALERLGEVLDRREEARRVAAGMEARLAAIRRRTEGVTRRRVLVVVGREPLYVAGPGSHFDEMIRLAGGVNVAHDALSPYQLLSMEAVLERMPEVIVDSSDNRPGALRGRRPGRWGQWPFLPAVAADRVYGVDPGRLAIPGVRLPAMTELMARMIHPELFGEVTPRELGPLEREEAEEDRGNGETP